MKTAAEGALGASRELLESMLDAVTEAVTVVSAEGRLVYANAPALTLLGYGSLDELFAASAVLEQFELLTSTGEPLPLERLPNRRVLAGEGPVSEPVRYRVRSTGEERHSLVRALPVPGAGAPAYAISVFEDQTERLRAEAEHHRLERVTEAALTHLSLNELLDELLARLIELLPADTAAIFLLDESGEALEVRATIGLERGAEYRRVPLGRGFAGRVAAERRPLIAGDLAGVELFNSVLADRGIHSLIGVPLLLRRSPIGVLRAGATARDRFTAEDTRVLELAADRIALAINQAKLDDAATRAQTRLQLLAAASDVLASSLDVDVNLAAVARLVVPGFAGLCAIHLLEDDGSIRPLAIVHEDAATSDWMWKLSRERPFDLQGSQSIPAVIRTGRAELVQEVDAERVDRLAAERPDHEALLRALAGSSAITAPLAARGRTFGALSIVSWKPGRSYGADDLAFAGELGRRAAVALDNALLYREAEERGRAARILESVGDGVVLVGGDGLVRYWNEAAASITGLATEDVLDRPAGGAIPGWSTIEPLVPMGGPPQSMPLQLGGGETWLSISGVALEEGTVYAFRDLTEERALEQLRADFVATVSHELRTPLAAIYGAAMTLRRGDVDLGDDQRANLLGVVASESDRLARTVNDILWANRLDGNTLSVAIESCDPVALAESVLAAQHVHVPPGIELAFAPVGPLPEVAADGDKVRQVLVNLVDNAIKYSPDGGRVALEVGVRGGHVRFAVADEGLGIPYADQRRIFDKFYRLDPQLTRGVGGTGLGLYISQELVRRMNGRIWVQSESGRGSTFFVELPVAGGAGDARLSPSP